MRHVDADRADRVQHPGHVRTAAPVDHLLGAIAVVAPQREHVAVVDALVQERPPLRVEQHPPREPRARAVGQPAPDTAPMTAARRDRKRRQQTLGVARDQPRADRRITTRLNLAGERLTPRPRAPPPRVTPRGAQRNSPEHRAAGLARLRRVAESGPSPEDPPSAPAGRRGMRQCHSEAACGSSGSARPERARLLAQWRCHIARPRGAATAAA